MSERSIRRSRERELERAERRRTRLVKRATLSTGAALGGTALLAPAALGADFPVTTTADSGAGSLRNQIAAANAAGGADSISFSGAGASGEIRLTTGEIAITEDLTINGPGAGALALSGDADDDNVRDFANSGSPGDSRIFNITDATNPGSSPVQSVTISGLTLREGVASGYSSGYQTRSGGAIVSANTVLTLDDVNLSDNVATQSGGAVATQSVGSSVVLTDSLVSGNRALFEGGGIAMSSGKYSAGADNVITNSTISGNTVGGTIPNFGTGFGPSGGGLSIDGGFEIASSTISGNTASTLDGSDYQGRAGGVYLNGPGSTTATVISGNTAGDSGGGLVMQGGKLLNSTVSGNTATDDDGGGLVTTNGKYGAARVDGSTISGNSAGGGVGGGIFALGYQGSDLIVRGSTIAANSAGAAGGVYASTYEPPDEPIVNLRGSLVADNGGTDAGQAEPNSISAGFSLVEAPGGIVFEGDPAGSSIIGVDPLLGPLADNGGPTRTHAIAATSAAIDAAQAGPLTNDQRGQARTVDAAASNAPLSDGTDIGAFELQDASATGDDDVTEPTTTITKKPKKKLKAKGKKKLAKATWEFTGTDSSGGPVTFECKLDKGPFEPCTSPVKEKLDKGKHTFEVRAVDGAGNADGSPSTAKTKVKPKKKPKN